MPRVIHDETLITKMLSELQTNWEIAGAMWRDRARAGFEEAYMNEIIPDVKRASDAMARISRVLRKAVRECT